MGTACATPQLGSVAADVAGLAMGATQAGIGIVRGVIGALVWGGCGTCCSPSGCGHGGCDHGGCGCASHTYVYECYPSHHCGGHHGCCC